MWHPLIVVIAVMGSWSVGIAIRAGSCDSFEPLRRDSILLSHSRLRNLVEVSAGWSSVIVRFLFLFSGVDYLISSPHQTVGALLPIWRKLFFCLR